MKIMMIMLMMIS